MLERDSESSLHHPVHRYCVLSLILELGARGEGFEIDHSFAVQECWRTRRTCSRATQRGVEPNAGLAWRIKNCARLPARLLDHAIILSSFAPGNRNLHRVEQKTKGTHGVCVCHLLRGETRYARLLMVK